MSAEGAGARSSEDGANDRSENVNPVNASTVTQELRHQSSPESQNDGDSAPDHSLRSPLKGADSDEDGLIRDTPSPTSTTEDAIEPDQRMSQSAHSQTHPSPEPLMLLNSPYASQRVRVSSSSVGLSCV